MSNFPLSGADNVSAVTTGRVSGSPDFIAYAIDFVERGMMFWNTMRERGDNFFEHERQGLPAFFDFKWELLLDARTFARPVNYALLRITDPRVGSWKTNMRSTHVVKASQDRSASILPAERHLAFAIHVGTRLCSRFETLRDAVAAAKLLKWQEPLERIFVTDLRTGQVVIETYV